MDIRNWPLGRIMQLPDHMFGSRWIVSATTVAALAQHYFAMSQQALPDVGVIWEFLHIPHQGYSVNDYVRIALGDQLPTTEAQFLQLEPLFKGYGTGTGRIRNIVCPFYNTVTFSRLKLPVAAQGRHLIVDYYNSAEAAKTTTVALVVSGIPTETVDWRSSA